MRSATSGLDRRPTATVHRIIPGPDCTSSANAGAVANVHAADVNKIEVMSFMFAPTNRVAVSTPLTTWQKDVTLPIRQVRRARPQLHRCSWQPQGTLRPREALVGHNRSAASVGFATAHALGSFHLACRSGSAFQAEPLAIVARGAARPEVTRGCPAPARQRRLRVGPRAMRHRPAARPHAAARSGFRRGAMVTFRQEPASCR